VISPEGCASILWKNAEKMREAAEALRLTAQDLIKLGVADRVIEEPNGGAHRDKDATYVAVGSVIADMLKEFDGMKGKAIMQARRTKFLEVGSKGLAA
jgi:acetyl-CoA carboxylase carboxyl transferase subunit alpha